MAEGEPPNATPSAAAWAISSSVAPASRAARAFILAHGSHLLKTESASAMSFFSFAPSAPGELTAAMYAPNASEAAFGRGGSDAASSRAASR